MSEGRRRRGPWRENTEALATAVVLALVIRHFCFEAFQIPTGSMAPTLKGIHRTMACPNCTRRFGLDAGRSAVLCPNCLYEFSRDEVLKSPCRRFPTRQIGWIQWFFGKALTILGNRAEASHGVGGGNRILVNKFQYDYEGPKRWDIVVFKFPKVKAVCRTHDCGRVCRDMPRRVTPAACPMCGSRDIEVRPDLGSLYPIDIAGCRAAGCGWQERTRRPGARCPVCDARMRIVDKKNYIKRLIALPSETLRVRHGDIYINGKIARKSDKAQAAMWRFVYDSALPNRLPDRSLLEVWKSRSGLVEPKEKGFVLSPSSDDRMAWADFVKPITDYPAYSGYDGESVPVGDVKVEAELLLPVVSSTTAIQIFEDERPETVRGSRRVYEVRIKTRVDSAGKPDRWVRVLANEREVADKVKLGPGADSLCISFWTADDAVGLSVNGRPVMTKLFNRAPGDVPARGYGSGVAVGVRGARLDVRRLRVWRDTYYRTDTRAAVFVSADVDLAISKHGYFMMGDNSRHSSDSRMWGEAPADYVIGKAFVRWYPFDDVREVW